jgi:hypothetical protein
MLVWVMDALHLTARSPPQFMKHEGKDWIMHCLWVDDMIRASTSATAQHFQLGSMIPSGPVHNRLGILVALRPSLM